MRILLLMPVFTLTLCCLTSAHAAERAWDQVPGLRAFVENPGQAIEVPTDEGTVRLVLGEKTGVPLPFEDFPGRYDSANFDFREGQLRNTFHVFALLGGDLPVRAVLVDGDWVDRVPLQLAQVVGVAADLDYADRFDRYTVHATQHDGLFCITRGATGRWLLRYDAKALGSRFSLGSFISTEMEFILGSSAQARSDTFRKESLVALGDLLRLGSADADEKFFKLKRLYALGEFVNADAPQPWRQQFIAELRAQLDKTLPWWDKASPLKGAALRKAVEVIAAADLDAALPIDQLQAAWVDTQVVAAQKAKPGSAPSQTEPPGPIEKAFWEEFANSAEPGVTKDHVRPFARLLAKRKDKSQMLEYLGRVLVLAAQPDQSPYLGAAGEERLNRLADAMLALEKPKPGRQEIIAAIQAFDEFFLKHKASLNLQYTANLMFAKSETAMHAATHLRSGDSKPAYFERWAKVLASTLVTLGNAAAAKKLAATTMALYLHSWLLSHPEATGLPPARFTDLQNTGSVDVLLATQLNAAALAWYNFWPALDPSARETAALVDLLNRDPILARTHLASLLNLTPGDPATFGNLLLKRIGGTPNTLLAVAGDPPALYGVSDARAKQPPVWPASLPPGVREAQNQLAAARKALADQVSLYENMRRFWGLDERRKHLANYDRTPSGSSTARNEAAQRAYAEANAKYQRDLHEGVYVGRSMERFDTVYTRSLTSGERMLREIELDRLKRNMDDERMENQRRDSEQIAHAEVRDRLTDEIFEIEKKVDTAGHLAKIAPLKRSVEYYEERVTQLLRQGTATEDGSGLTLESLVRAQSFRWLLTRATESKMVSLIDKAQRSGSPDDTLEAQWYVWLLTIHGFAEKQDGATFFANESDRINQEDALLRGPPLGNSAVKLLAPLSSAAPAALEYGPDPATVPRLTPSAQWRLNQVAGLLDDCWFRLHGIPVLMRKKMFEIVKVLRDTTGNDAVTVESLRPWVKRFRARAPADLQKETLRWDKEPKLSELMELAGR